MPSDPRLAARFFEWLGQLGEDLREASTQRGFEQVATRLSEGFGAEPVEKAFGRFGESYLRGRQRGALGFASSSGLLSASSATKVRDHDFFGGEHAR